MHFDQTFRKVDLEPRNSWGYFVQHDGLTMRLLSGWLARAPVLILSLSGLVQLIQIWRHWHTVYRYPHQLYFLLFSFYPYLYFLQYNCNSMYHCAHRLYIRTSTILFQTYLIHKHQLLKIILVEMLKVKVYISIGLRLWTYYIWILKLLEFHPWKCSALTTKGSRIVITIVRSLIRTARWPTSPCTQVLKILITLKMIVGQIEEKTCNWKIMRLWKKLMAIFMYMYWKRPQSSTISC